MIHPDFFIDEDVAMLSPWARLLLISLLTQADREGRLADREKRIHLRSFPWDREVDTAGHLCELAEQGFIVRYSAEGGKYISIRNFLKFQKPHPKEAASTIPAPPDPAGALPGTAGKGRNEPEDSAGVGIRNTESESDTETEHSVQEIPSTDTDERRSESVESPDGWPTIEVYGSAVVDLWHELRGSPFPQPGPADFLVLSDWHASGIPVRVVERGMKDCIQGLLKRRDRPTGKPLKYFDGAVREAYGQWRARTA